MQGSTRRVKNTTQFLVSGGYISNLCVLFVSMISMRYGIVCYRLQNI